MKNLNKPQELTVILVQDYLRIYYTFQTLVVKHCGTQKVVGEFSAG